MQSGKKSVAERIVYGAFDRIAEKAKDKSPLDVLQTALENVKPRLEVKSRRVGGANYQVPVEVSADRQEALAMRWMIQYASARKGTAMTRRAGGGNFGCVQQYGRVRQEARRHAQDGAGQPCVCALPLVVRRRIHPLGRVHGCVFVKFGEQ